MFCKIIFLSVFGHLNVQPNCDIVQNLYWSSTIQYNTANHTSDFIILLRKFIQYDLLRPFQ